MCIRDRFSVLTDDMEHCIITGDGNVAIHHVFNGANRKRSEKYGLDVYKRQHESWRFISKNSIIIYQRFIITKFGKACLDSGQ